MTFFPNVAPRRETTSLLDAKPDMPMDPRLDLRFF